MVRPPLRLSLALVAATAVAACGHRATGPVAPEKPDDEAWLDPQMDRSGIVVQPARIEKVPTEITTSGTIAFSDTHVSHVYSPVSGRIIRLIAGLGQLVKVGDPLCVIDSPDLGSAYSDLSKAHADLIAAKADYDRQQSLLAQGAAAQAQVETSKDSYEKALAEFERARQKVETLRADPSAGDSTSHYTQTSPIEGEVVARNATLGYEIQGILSGASVATEIYTIGDLHEVWAWLDIYERDLGLVEAGDVVHLRVPAYDQSFDGKIDYVGQVVDPQSHTVKVRAVVPNPGDLLKAQMFAKATIDTGIDNVLAVPLEATILDGDEYVVFVQKTDDPLHFVRTPVQIRIEGDWAEIRGGDLKVGAPVVVKGAAELLGLM